MATTYTSTIEIKVWKAHTCRCCGQHYRYLFERKKRGQGRNAEAASAAAHKAVVAALAHEVDQQPCPTCGLYQPDMVAARRRRQHWLVFWIAMLGFGVFLVLAATELLTLHTVAVQTTMLALVCLAAHALIDGKNPNRDLEANLSTANRRLDAGTIWVPEGQRSDHPETAEVPGAWTAGHSVAYALLLLAVLLTAAPAILRATSGWVLSPDWYPGVAGPGDQTHIYFPKTLTSVKGYWNGIALAEVANAREVGLPLGSKLETRTQADTWPAQIKIGSKESKTSTRTPWAAVIVPNQPDLAGKTLQLNLRLQATFPQLMGAQYQVITQEFTQTASLPLSSPGCGAQFASVFRWGVGGGGALMAVLSATLAILAGAYRRQSLPTEIFRPEAPAEGQP